jgi:hypothetical protein
MMNVRKKKKTPNKWPQICSVCRNHNSYLSSFMIYHRVCDKSNTCGIGTANPPGGPEVTPGFSGDRVARSLVALIWGEHRKLSTRGKKWRFILFSHTCTLWFTYISFFFTKYVVSANVFQLILSNPSYSFLKCIKEEFEDTKGVI